MALGAAGAAGLLNQDQKYEWVKGHPDASPIPDELTQFLDQIVFPYYYILFDKEDEKEVIERAIVNMSELAEELGPAAFKNQIPRVTEYIIKFLEKKAFCQTGELENPEDDKDVVEEDDSEEAEDDDEDDIDHDEIILGNISDFINALAKAYGDLFAETFAKIAPKVWEYTSDKHPKNDRNTAIGCFAETFAAAPATIGPYQNDYLQMLNKCSGTKDSKVNRNLAYAIGVLAQHSPTLFTIISLDDALGLLNKLHENSDSPDAQDNIVAATVRIAEYQMMGVPLDQRPAQFGVIVNSLYQRIPFQGDE